jgi:hypothetical protein
MTTRYVRMDDSDGKAILVNPPLVTCVRQHGKHVHIYFAKDDSIPVKQNLEEVLARLMGEAG